MTFYLATAPAATGQEKILFSVLSFFESLYRRRKKGLNAVPTTKLGFLTEMMTGLQKQMSSIKH